MKLLSSKIAAAASLDYRPVQCAICFIVVMLTTMLAMSSASGGITLWTTQEDFTVVPTGNTGWSGGNAGEQTIATVATPDSDGSSTNGSANYTAPGAAGTPGALSVQWTGGTYNFFYGPDLTTKTAAHSGHGHTRDH